MCIFSLTLLSCNDTPTNSPKVEPISKITASTAYIQPEAITLNGSDGFEDSYREQATLSNTDYVSSNITYAVGSVANTSSSFVSNSEKSKVQVAKQKIIKNGNLRIKTKDFKGSKKSIDNLVKLYGGFYETEELDKNEERIQFYLVVRVSPKKFEKLIQGLENGKDEIQFKKVNANNVTEEFLDIETRLVNKRKYLKRYQELLSKAKNVNEVLNIEENIRQLMEEIESKEGRLKYLNDQVDLSTIQITLFKELPVKQEVVYEVPFLTRVKNALTSGWDSIVNFMLWSVSKWPMIFIISVTAWWARKQWKKRKKA